MFTFVAGISRLADTEEEDMPVLADSTIQAGFPFTWRLWYCEKQNCHMGK